MEIWWSHQSRLSSKSHSRTDTDAHTHMHAHTATVLDSQPSCSNRQLRNQSATLNSELKKVFGEDVNVDVEDPNSGIQDVAIILVIVLVACMMLLVLAVLLLIW